MNAGRRQRGFTLGETLTTLAVAGIGLSLAVPGLQSLTHSDHVAASVNQLVGTLHVARSEAVTRNDSVTVCASSDGATCNGSEWEHGWIAFLDANADATHDPAELLLDRVGAVSALAVRSAELGGALTYRPNGHVTTATHDPAGGQFSFCESAAVLPARIVMVRTNGLPTLATGADDASRDRCPDPGD